MSVECESTTGEHRNPTLDDSVKDLSRWMNGMLFSKVPGMRKSAWETEEGKLQMHFRGCVIREVIRRIEDGAAEVMEDIKKMEGEEWDGTIPEWMEPGFIKPADVEAILKAKAGAGGSQGRRLRTKPHDGGLWMPTSGKTDIYTSTGVFIPWSAIANRRM